MHKELDKAEAAGRGGDSFLGHLSPGDTVIPRGMMQPEWKEFLRNHFDVDTYTVGNKKNSLNPFTGLPEFLDDPGSIDSGPQNVDDPGSIDSGPQNVAAGTDTTTFDAQGYGFGDLMNALGQGIGDAIGGLFGVSVTGVDNPETAGYGGYDNGMIDVAPGGGSYDSNNPLQAAAQQIAPVNMASTIPSLTNPMVADVPDNLPRIGEYYSLLRQGNSAAAENMLRQYMRGDNNLYGR